MPVLMIEVQEYELAMLQSIFDRIQVVEITDDSVDEDNVVDLTPAVDPESFQTEGVQTTLPLPEAAQVGGTVPAIDPARDATAPENLGVRLEEPAPPTIVEEGTHNTLGPDAYGAGPPPREG